MVAHGQEQNDEHVQGKLTHREDHRVVAHHVQGHSKETPRIKVA